MSLSDYNHYSLNLNNFARINPRTWALLMILFCCLNTCITCAAKTNGLGELLKSY
jgi:hypothetical protein